MPDRQIVTGINVTSDGIIPNLDRLSNLLAVAARDEQISGEIGIWLCTDAEIADLHVQFMSIPGPTDVISFPSDDEPGGYLGDIAVSVDTAAAQALDAGHSLQREVAYLCLHGFLHLAGYDDLEPEARREMIERQDALLDSFEREYPGGW